MAAAPPNFMLVISRFPCVPVLATVVLSLAPAAAQAVVAEAAEPNESVAAATELTCGAHGYGSLVQGGDVDTWSFVVASPLTDVTAFTTSRGARQIALDPGGTSASDTVLELVDVDGVTVLQSNDDWLENRSFEESGFFSSVRARALPPGTYFLRVRGFSPVEMGDYAVEVFCRDSAGPLVFCDTFVSGPAEVEPNDGVAESGVLPIHSCTTVSGTISPPAAGGGIPGITPDEDWWTVTLAEDMALVLEVFGDVSAGDPLVDPEVLVFAADGTTLVGEDDDSGLSLNARLELTLPAGDFFVLVRGVPGPLQFGQGDYTVRLDGAASLAPVLASVITDAEPGAACLTSLGVPLGLVSRKNEFPQLGGQFTVDLDGFAAGSGGGLPTPVLLLSIGTPTIFPLSLDPAGALGCFLSVQPSVGALPTVATVPGESEISFAIPTTINLGVMLEMQGLALDFAANPFGIVASGRLRARLGNDG